MTKLEIAEIKKLYKINNCSIQRMAGCYVDAEGNIKSTFAKTFLNLDEEEMFKYLEIFKKGLSGSVGKNIVTSEFPISCEGPDTMHDLLLKLRDTHLKNDDILQIFYEKVIEFYPEVENYLILLISNAYDVPARGDDHFKNIDASDEVYDYITVYLCPVKLEDGGLSYDMDKNEFVRKDRRWCVTVPTYSLLFPSFEDRSANIHQITIYTKKTNGAYDDFTQNLLNIEPVMAADTQKFVFQSAVQEAVKGQKNALETVQAIQEVIAEKINNKEDSLEPVVFDSDTIEEIVKGSGMSEESQMIFSKEIKKSIGKNTIAAENIIDKKILQVKAPDIVVKVSQDIAHKVKTQVIDNGKYLLVPIESESDVEVNGVSLGREEK